MCYIFVYAEGDSALFLDEISLRKPLPRKAFSHDAPQGLKKVKIYGILLLGVVALYIADSFPKRQIRRKARTQSHGSNGENPLTAGPSAIDSVADRPTTTQESRVCIVSR